MKIHTPIVAAIFLSVLSGMGLGQTTYTVRPSEQSKTVEEPLKPLAEIIEVNVRGHLDSNIYKNEFFGLKFTLPEKWIVQRSEVGEAVANAGAEAVNGKTAAAEKSFNEAMGRMVVLFTVSKDIMGIADNAVFMASAEPSTPLTQFRNGTDYLRLSLQTMKQLRLPPDFQFSETIRSDTFGQETIPYIQIDRTGFHQRIYAIQRRGYAVFFTLSYVTESDLDTMRDIFRNGDFKLK